MAPEKHLKQTSHRDEQEQDIQTRLRPERDWRLQLVTFTLEDQREGKGRVALFLWLQSELYLYYLKIMSNFIFNIINKMFE